MRHRNISAARRLIPLTGLLLATTLGGCVAYTGYPPAGYSYNYGYPSYYSGYPASYGYSYNSAPGYLPTIRRVTSTRRTLTLAAVGADPYRAAVGGEPPDGGGTNST